jgi:hypothetical protein
LKPQGELAASLAGSPACPCVSARGARGRLEWGPCPCGGPISRSAEWNTVVELNRSVGEGLNGSGEATVVFLGVQLRGGRMHGLSMHVLLWSVSARQPALQGAWMRWRQQTLGQTAAWGNGPAGWPLKGVLAMQGAAGCITLWVSRAPRRL